MCYNISNHTKDESVLAKRLGAVYPAKLGQLKIQFAASGFAHPQWPVVCSSDPNEIVLSQWGLIPSWTRNETLAADFRKNNLNAKSETVFEKPSFKIPIFTRRCIIPVTAFFEWREVSKQKYPYLIHVKEEEIFCLGGIYDKWIDKKTGEELHSFSILTTEANPLMEKIHNLKKRMPFILPKEMEKEWLRKDLKEEEIKKLMLPFPEEKMQAFTISKLITSRTADVNTEKVLEPCFYPELELYDS